MSTRARLAAHFPAFALEVRTPRVTLRFPDDDDLVELATATFETGSWLGVDFQGQGIGKEMRAAALHLGFDAFGARRAITAAFADNPSKQVPGTSGDVPEVR